MTASKRTRDYRAEEARRNERARALGFTSRAQMRRALRKGEFTPLRASASPRARIVGGSSANSEIKRLRKESREWSKAHSRVEASRYKPSFTDERVRRYHAAYVNDDTRAYRIENGLDSLRDYLVDDLGYYEDAEFDERYGTTL